MNHQPFEDWLLAEEPLNPLQKRELQAHLHSCTDCSALVEVDLALKSIKVEKPAEGFASRFQVRLAGQRKALRRRNFLGFLILVLSAASILLWLSWPTLKGIIQSPVDFLASWLSYLVSLIASLQAVGHVSKLLLRSITDFVPAYVWTAILFSVVGWSLLWVVSMMKFTKLPQGV